MDVHEFKQSLASLMQQDRSGLSESAQLDDPKTTPPTFLSPLVLTEIKARYIWLSTVMLDIVIPLYVSFTCAPILDDVSSSYAGLD
jgi:hypothetical protein